MTSFETISFDFWDTLAKDDSDEPKRRSKGLAPKSDVRLQLLTDEIRRTHFKLTLGAIKKAFQDANQEFTRIWLEEHKTLTVRDRLLLAYQGLGIAKTPGLERVVLAIEEMEFETQPDPVEDLKTTLEAMASHAKLAIISDTIHSPGRVLKKILEGWGVLKYFSAFVFSDECGHSKPDPYVFEKAAKDTGTRCASMAHIGDRPDKDLYGPFQVGATGVLLTAIKDRRQESAFKSHAELIRSSKVCERFSDLPQLLFG